MSLTPPELAPEVIQAYLGYIAWRRQTKIEQRANFDEKYPEDPITAFLTTGLAYFDKEILIARKRELLNFKPWQVFHNGEANIFHQRVPGRRYVLGGDVATGRTVSSDNTDYCAAVVLDLETGEEHAAYRARVTPYDFALDMDELGRYFNNASIAIERTGDGGTTILALQGECQYGNVFKFKEWHRRQRTKMIELEGFPTTGRTRPIALNFLNQFILDYPEMIWDAKFIDEALVFVRDEKGRPAAAPGAHDDTVSARWIAHAARRYLMGWWLPTEAKTERYIPADQLVAN